MSNSKQIKLFLEEYVKSGSSGSAMMINGEWGSGKTYFINKELRPFIEKNLNKKTIYITLNGISNKEDISKEIFFQSIPIKEKSLPEWMSKVKSYGTEIGKVVLDKLSISDNTVDYSNLLDIKESILIFDDLERCLIDIREIMGYINKFVEHMEVCTIIVANENEISERSLQNNQELKYFLATLDSVQYKINEGKSGLARKQSADNKKLNPDEIKSRIEYLFGEEVYYHQIKEKLVSKTLFYEPDINIVFEQILSDYDFIHDEHEIIKSKKIDTANRFLKENHNNLRTLQFIFMNIQMICKQIRDFKFEDGEKVTIISKLFDYLMVLSVRYKKLGKIQPWLSKGEYDQISLSGELWAFDYVLGFGFINELVANSYLDVERMKFALHQYIDEQRKSGLANEDPLNDLSSWWYMEDEDVIKIVKNINDNIAQNLYQASVYPKIISSYLVLEDIGFDVEIEEIFNKMVDNIKIAKDINMTEFDMFSYSIDEKHSDRYSKYMYKLNDEITSRQSDIYKNKINDYLVIKDGWSRKFEDYITNHKNDFLNRKKFFSLINVGDFSKALDEAKNVDIIYIRRALDSVYNFSNLNDFYNDDLPTIELLITDLTSMMEKNKAKYGRIKNNQLSYLVKQLEKYKANLS